MAEGRNMPHFIANTAVINNVKAVLGIFLNVITVFQLFLAILKIQVKKKNCIL